MSRVVPLNARLAGLAEDTGEVPVVLIKITHPDLAEPVRLSTDATVRLSDDPLRYGTLSTWKTDDESPFVHAVVEAVLPEDGDDLGPQASLVIDTEDDDFMEILAEAFERGTVHMAVVLASTPDVVVMEIEDFELVGVSREPGSDVLTIAREDVSAEPLPSGRMTRDRFPGLFR